MADFPLSEWKISGNPGHEVHEARGRIAAYRIGVHVGYAVVLESVVIERAGHQVAHGFFDFLTGLRVCRPLIVGLAGKI